MAYASGKWTECQSRYTTTELELLAVIRAVTRFRWYVLGTEFTVVTDHQALRWLWRLKDPSGRLARWVMELSQYNFTVIHRPGATIPHADALSRDDGSASVGKEPADGLSCSDGTRSVSRGLQCERESSDSEAAGREPTKGLSSGGGTSRKLVHGIERDHELSVRGCTCAAAAGATAASRAVGVEDSDRPSANSAVG